MTREENIRKTSDQRSCVGTLQRIHSSARTLIYSCGANWEDYHHLKTLGLSNRYISCSARVGEAVPLSEAKAFATC